MQDVAWGVGLATVTSDARVLDVWYPSPLLGVPDLRVAEGLKSLLSSFMIDEPDLDLKTIIVQKRINLSSPPRDVPDAYLRLHLLSHRQVRPHGLSVENIFSVLPNIAWTTSGARLPLDFPFASRRSTIGNLGTARPKVLSVDKFPRMVDYVVPDGVQISSGSRVRLGAYLSAGTTVTHEGLVDFNAGTLGPAVIEGRLSSGVVVGEDSELGDGASTMGTLWSRGGIVIHIGRRCRIGANAGVGISLGDDCVVKPGCYITAGVKIALSAEMAEMLDKPRICKARELSGIPSLVYGRSPTTGAIEVFSLPTSL